MGKGSEDEVPLDLAEVERHLRERQAEISERVGTLTKPPERGAGVQFGKRVGDGTTEAVSRLTEVGVVRDLSASSERIKRALEKLDEGSYGRCDACEEAIPRGRLESMPESVLCVECARKAPRRR